MASNLPPAFQRAKQALRFARVDEIRAYQAQELANDAIDAVDGREKLRLAQQVLEYYPYNTESWSAVGYHYLNDEKNYQASIEAFKTGIEAARIVNPMLTPEREEPIEWDNIDNRPYLRTIEGLALVYAESGNSVLAIETAELLAKWGRTTLNGKLAGWYILAARWNDAHQFLQVENRRLKEKDHTMDAGIAYSWLLVHYHAVEEGNVDSDEELYEALGQALKSNIHVPTLLITNDVQSRARPKYVSSGDEDEALSYVIDNLKLWEAIPGAIEWLLSTKERYGRKPNEETFIQMLRKQRVFVEIYDRPAKHITQNHKNMVGTALPEFRMPPECSQPHINGAVIHAQTFEFGSRDNWIQFRYDDVESVPFWSTILATIEDREEPAQEENPEIEPKQDLNQKQKHNRKRRDRKKRNHQKKALERGTLTELTHENVSDITSFLNLKEKAVTRSLNKIWLKGSTLVTKVDVDPNIVGADLDGALRFVALSFPNLKHFMLNVDQEFFLNLNNTYSYTQYGTNTFGDYYGGEDSRGSRGCPQLSGDSLKRIFEQESIYLDSVCIYFDECVTEHTSRILVDEEGLSTLHQQVSLRKLELVHPSFASFRSLFSMLRPLVNLQCLRLTSPHFPESEYEFGDRDCLWRYRSDLMKAIGSLPNLRSLMLEGHQITDNDLRHLSRLRDLRRLAIEGHFGSEGGISLTDVSMTFIASRFPKLKCLSVCYNRAITITGLQKVIRSCPLFMLEASEAGLGEEHLDNIVRNKPSLRFIRYGQGYLPTKNDFLKNATISSRGLCGFAGNLGIYEPKFHPTLLANHYATKKFIEDVDSRMSYLYED